MVKRERLINENLIILLTMVSAELLSKNGFVKRDYISKFESMFKKSFEKSTSDEWNDFIEKLVDVEVKNKKDPDKARKDAKEKILKDMAEIEELEVQKETYQPSGFPKPQFPALRLVHESFSQSIEEAYYWILRSLQIDFGIPNAIKTIDSFAASEHSAFFGVASQRLGIQQDKVSQYLATIGKMLKDMFQIVRELRIMDERLELYKEADEGKQASDITLKGIWIDLVEGGSKNPASVYGMATQLGFAILPDLFFSTMIREGDDVDKVVDSMEFNDHVKRVLKRKLNSFRKWQTQTKKEIEGRRKFTIQYLYQHYHTIKLYMDWVRPYLRNIKRLTADMDKLDSVDLVSAFEGSVVEIEVLAYKKFKKTKYNGCVLAHFYYRTSPSMSYQEEGYQRGPLHVGRVEITLRGYTFTDKQIENFKKMRREEDFEILGSLNETIEKSMAELGGDVEKYIKEAEDKTYKKSNDSSSKKKKESTSEESILEPFLGLVGFFKDALKPIAKVDLVGSVIPNTKEKFADIKDQDAYKAAVAQVRVAMAKTYENFKKAHGMLAW